MSSTSCSPRAGSTPAAPCHWSDRSRAVRVAPVGVTTQPAPDEAPAELKAGALSFISNVVIGVASTAPGYSLAATLGLIAAVEGIGLKSPAIMIVSFLPMLCIAAAYY